MGLIGYYYPNKWLSKCFAMTTLVARIVVYLSHGLIPSIELTKCSPLLLNSLLLKTSDAWAPFVNKAIVAAQTALQNLTHHQSRCTVNCGFILLIIVVKDIILLELF